VGTWVNLQVVGLNVEPKLLHARTGVKSSTCPVLRAITASRSGSETPEMSGASRTTAGWLPWKIGGHGASSNGCCSRASTGHRSSSR
jgi:hypothetical protein